MGTQSTWGVFSSQDKIKEVLPVLLVVLVLHQVSCDWTGTGELSCYGHLSTDVSTPEGGGYLEQGHLDCDIIEWDGSNGLGPEAMFFKADSGSEWEVWAWDYHEWVTGLYHLPPVRVISGIRRMTWVPGTAP